MYCNAHEKRVFEAVRVFRRVERLARENKIGCLKLLENVVAGPEDIDLMSERHRTRPVFIEPGEVRECGALECNGFQLLSAKAPG